MRSIRGDRGPSRVRGTASRGPRWTKRLAAGLVCVAGLAYGVLAQPQTSVALPNPPAPGLPEFYVGITNKLFDPPVLVRGRPQVQVNQRSVSGSALAAGQGDAKRAKLGIRLPITLTAVNSVTDGVNTPVFNRRTGLPTGVEKSYDSYSNFVYVKSPRGVSPAYGVMPPTTITTLAFGMLPVTVTLLLSQPRRGQTPANPSGTPTPLFANVFQDYRPGKETIYDATVSGPLTMRLTNVAVDGKKIDVGDVCQTVSPSTLSLVSKASITDPLPGYYSPIYGGDLYGTLSVPAFAGCRGESGEDLSALFTNALSGKDTAVHLNQGALGQPDNVTCAPPTIGQLACRQPKVLALPTGPGQVASTPPNWTPNLPPAPEPVLPNS